MTKIPPKHTHKQAKNNQVRHKKLGINGFERFNSCNGSEKETEQHFEILKENYFQPRILKLK